MRYRCQSCNRELPDVWSWRVVDEANYLMVVTCPHCNNEFVRLEHDADAPYGYRVTPSRIFVPQGSRKETQGER